MYEIMLPDPLLRLAIWTVGLYQELHMSFQDRRGFEGGRAALVVAMLWSYEQKSGGGLVQKAFLVDMRGLQRSRTTWSA